ncbi:acyclic terpene utilization AtuA family protein [Proteiniclasticum ruminis]|uniref:Acyclic terpene utilisation N-terminal domain-containing protein n=1 Tax=Proteiniclasticum ruminis TaxID=398199 RepID=A0A1G8JZQ2_9CLOT|nr:acyclic terpene utilization AtuA family protein [Proteiniclasticum ruminis]SDI36696.1 Protein of unknown function [Proteiniclasticum ruminis]
MKKKITIGGGQGFWGDSPDAAIEMINSQHLNYMAMDFLAELTLSIMQRQKLKNPKAGYARDFIGIMNEIIETAQKKGTKIITNAGGTNIISAVEALEKVVRAKGVTNYKIGYVLGDDIMDKMPMYMEQGIPFINTDNGRRLEEIKDKIVNVNVYHGHEPIEECLRMGADAVITGRSSDSALFMAPLKYEFGWKNDDYDQLARGIMVGHLLECGGQASGGNYDYDWRNVPDMDLLGFPIAEVEEDSLVITKSETSGGLITEQSLKEQILYEVHDPGNYITPDVNVDISAVKLKEVGKNRVAVEDIKGKGRPDQLKLCVGYLDGYKVETFLSFAYPDAYEKAEYASKIIMKKMKRKNLVYKDIRIDYIGLNALHLNTADLSEEHVKNLNEVVLRIAIHTEKKEEAEKIVPEIAPLQLNGPPGSSFFGGRAKVREVIGLWPTFIPRDAVNLTSHVLEVR